MCRPAASSLFNGKSHGKHVGRNHCGPQFFDSSTCKHSHGARRRRARRGLTSRRATRRARQTTAKAARSAPACADRGAAAGAAGTASYEDVEFEFSGDISALRQSAELLWSRGEPTPGRGQTSMSMVSPSTCRVMITQPRSSSTPASAVVFVGPKPLSCAQTLVELTVQLGWDWIGAGWRRRSAHLSSRVSVEGAVFTTDADATARHLTSSDATFARRTWLPVQHLQSAAWSRSSAT